MDCRGVAIVDDAEVGGADMLLVGRCRDRTQNRDNSEHDHDFDEGEAGRPFTGAGITQLLIHEFCPTIGCSGWSSLGEQPAVIRDRVHRRDDLQVRCNSDLNRGVKGVTLKTGMLEAKLLEILVCPVSKAPLVYKVDRGELWCKASGLAYPIRDDIPVMLADEARELSDEELRSLDA